MPTIKPPLHFPGVSSLPTAGQRLIEFLYPPDQLMPAPSPITSPGLAGSRLRQLGQYLWGDSAKPSHAIANDLYGTQPIMSRRGFLDRVAGNPQKRAVKRFHYLDNILEKFDAAEANKVHDYGMPIQLPKHIEAIVDEAGPLEELLGQRRDTLYDMGLDRVNDSSRTQGLLREVMRRFGAAPNPEPGSINVTSDAPPEILTKALRELKNRFSR